MGAGALRETLCGVRGGDQKFARDSKHVH